jgi:hypothetical protein
LLTDHWIVSEQEQVWFLAQHQAQLQQHLAKQHNVWDGQKANELNQVFALSADMTLASSQKAVLVSSARLLAVCKAAAP